jgi:hypothetical protein
MVVRTATRPKSAATTTPRTPRKLSTNNRIIVTAGGAPIIQRSGLSLPAMWTLVNELQKRSMTWESGVEHNITMSITPARTAPARPAPRAANSRQ